MIICFDKLAFLLLITNEVLTLGLPSFFSLHDNQSEAYDLKICEAVLLIIPETMSYPMSEITFKLNEAIISFVKVFKHVFFDNPCVMQKLQEKKEGEMELTKSQKLDKLAKSMGKN